MLFGKERKVSKNYYVSPYPEEYLKRTAVVASVVAIAAAVIFLPALVLFIYPGFGSLLWLYEAYEAQVAYFALFFCTLTGLVACAVMSFFAYKPRKEVRQSSGPSFGFKRSSYNGILITAVLASLMVVFQTVVLIGYHVSAGEGGYISEIISRHADALGNRTLSVDGAGIAALALYTLSAGASWTYYFYTFRVNRVMQLVVLDEPKEKKRKHPDAPAPPTDKETEESKPFFSFGLTEEEKNRGKVEFESDDDESANDADGGCGNPGDAENDDDKGNAGSGGENNDRKK